MQLSPEVLQQIQERKSLIDQQERILSALKLEMLNYVKQACGVDVEQGGYVLDLAKGTLEKAGENE